MSMLNHFFDYKPEVLALDEKVMELCQPYFRHMEEIRDYNQLKMLKAFADTQMSSTDMLGTTGYGLWDTGRAKLEQIFAEGRTGYRSPSGCRCPCPCRPDRSRPPAYRRGGR